MLSENGTKTTSANDDNVKRARIVLRAAIGTLSVRIRAGERFVHPIADVAAQNVTCKIRFLRLFRCHLCFLVKRLFPFGLANIGGDSTTCCTFRPVLGKQVSLSGMSCGPKTFLAV